MFLTIERVPLLVERGITLSPSQVNRLVTGTPERLSLAVLAATCDALECRRRAEAALISVVATSYLLAVSTRWIGRQEIIMGRDRPQHAG